MRKVTLSATQAGKHYFPEKFSYLSDKFEANPTAIINEHIIPTIEHYINLLCKYTPAPNKDTGHVLALTGEGACGLGSFSIADKNFYDELIVLSAQVTEERISKMAKEKGMYVAVCYYKRIGGNNYNVTAIFAPDGQIKGEYRKTHLPPEEMWVCVDGDDLNIIELDFGKVGVLTCYDLYFPEAASVLALKGAEILLHPTNGDFGEFTRRARANDNCVYLLTALKHVPGTTGSSSVIDRFGNVLVQTDAVRDSVCYYTVDLDERKVDPEWFYPAQLTGIADVWERKLQERNPAAYSILTQPAKRLRPADAKGREILREKMRKGECHW